MGGTGGLPARVVPCRSNTVSKLPLLLERQRLHTVSELGDVLTWNLEAFYLSYEELLQRVQR